MGLSHSHGDRDLRWFFRYVMPITYIMALSSFQNCSLSTQICEGQVWFGNLEQTLLSNVFCQFNPSPSPGSSLLFHNQSTLCSMYIIKEIFTFSLSYIHLHIRFIFFKIGRKIAEECIVTQLFEVHIICRTHSTSGTWTHLPLSLHF